MKRISTATKVADKFGAGKPGFTNGNAVTGLPSTDLEADWFDHLQEEVANVVEADGQVSDGSSYAQLLTALQSMFGGGVGDAVNMRATIASGASIATWTADEVVVKSALGGRPHSLTNFNQSLNTGVVGAGGMDVGTAPVSGFLAVYAIYNPTAKLARCLGQSVGAAAPTQFYSGANMPAGFTESALISIVPTDPASKFKLCVQRRRRISFPVINVLNAGTATAYTGVSLSPAVPKGAVRVAGNVTPVTTVGGNGVFIAADASGTGMCAIVNPVAGGPGSAAPYALDLAVDQLLYYLNTASGSAVITVTSYEI